jgi:hypothetical protein
MVRTSVARLVGRCFAKGGRLRHSGRSGLLVEIATPATRGMLGRFQNVESRPVLTHGLL